jgi:hypothetical protein
MHGHPDSFGRVKSKSRTIPPGLPPVKTREHGILATAPSAPTLEAEAGIEPANGSFADFCLTTWLLRRRWRGARLGAGRGLSMERMQYMKWPACAGQSAGSHNRVRANVATAAFHAVVAAPKAVELLHERLHDCRIIGEDTGFEVAAPVTFGADAGAS